MKDFYFRNFSSIESIGVMLFCALLAWGDKHFNFLVTPDASLISMTISSLIGLLGFVMAFTAIIFSLQESKKLKYFKDSSQYGNVINIFIEAILWIALVVFSLLAIFMVNVSLHHFSTTWLVSFSFFITVVKVSRCIWITKWMFNLSLD